MPYLFIDATSIGSGGGVTHIRELLRHANPQAYGFEEVEIWASEKLLQQLPDAKWLRKHSHPWLNGSFLLRQLWINIYLPKELRKRRYVVFLPSGNYVDYHPYISFCQNLQPFDPATIREYKSKREQLRYWLLRHSQSKSFKNADGVIYLTHHSMVQSFKYTGDLSHKAIIIPHAADSELFKPRHSEPTQSEAPFQLLYVSTLVFYKRQDVLLKALAMLKAEGYRVQLTLVGAWHKDTKPYLIGLMNELKLTSQDVRIVEKTPHAALPQYYAAADAFVMPSSCETFGITLLEAMQSGLPIVCAQNPSLLETLGDAGLTYPVMDAQSLKVQIIRLIQQPALRKELGAKAMARAAEYSWKKTADMTFAFFSRFI